MFWSEAVLEENKDFMEIYMIHHWPKDDVFQDFAWNTSQGHRSVICSYLFFLFPFFNTAATLPFSSPRVTDTTIANLKKKKNFSVTFRMKTSNFYYFLLVIVHSVTLLVKFCYHVLPPEVLVFSFLTAGALYTIGRQFVQNIGELSTSHPLLRSGKDGRIDSPVSREIDSESCEMEGKEGNASGNWHRVSDIPIRKFR